MLAILFVYATTYYLLSLDPSSSPNSRYTYGDPCYECGEDWEWYPNINEVNK